MSTYPYAPDDPGLRTCGDCGSQVYYTAICQKHGICFTCESKAGGICAQPERVVPPPLDYNVSRDVGGPVRENPAEGLYDYEEAERRER